MKRALLHVALFICSAYAVASACKDGTRDVIKGTRCRRYAECQNGSWHLKECKIGQQFDSNKLRCASVTDVGRCADDLKCSEGKAYSHLESNNLFYRCINGRISVQVCGVGQIFDHDLQGCRPDQAFQHTGLQRAKRDADKACKDGEKHRNGKSCRDYIECVNGQEVMKTCPDCMNFDNNTQTCRFVFVVPCEGYNTSTTPKPTDPPTTTQQPTDPPTTEQPTTPQPTNPPTTEQPPTPEPTNPSTSEQPPTPEPTNPSTTEQPPTPQPTDSPTSQPTDSPTESPLPDSTTPEAETTSLPSSTVAPCKEGEKVGLVDPECKSYQECKNGVWVNDACGWMRKFDVVKKECEYTLWNKVTCAK